jgi:type IV secretory pathway TrbF-like protein
MSRELSSNAYVAGALVATPAAGAFYHDRSYLAANNARNWRLGFFAALACCLGLTAAIVYLTSKQEEHHYLTKIYESGQVEVVALGPGKQDVADAEAVAWILRRWIEDIRTLTTDMDANKRRTAIAYRMCGEAAQKTIAASFKDAPPEERVAQGAIFPTKISVRQVSEKTWVVNWREEQKRDGVVVAVVPWQATLEVLLAAPTTRAEREASPAGVWIPTLAWRES